jgi:N-acyl-D-aspartate/D-glutamate deacylase
MVELLVRGGTVVDGTGGDPFRADVAVDRGRIAAVGAELELDADVVLDAGDLVVAPGFIDVHSHSDFTLLTDPRAVSAIAQGVTLEVVGNCGHGCFPVRDWAQAASAIYGYDDGLTRDWADADGYFTRLAVAQPAVNVLSLVPHGQLRLDTVGLSDRPATPEELTLMGRHLEASIEQGAWGLSTGLEYPCERAATEADVTELCRVAARAGGFYATHTRARDGGSAAAVEEAVRTAAAAEIQLQVSHLLPRSGEAEGHACLEAIERATRDDVAFDMHTRLYGISYLHSALPAWVLAEGPDRRRGLLADPSARARMRDETTMFSAADWSRVVLLDSATWPDLARRDVASIASERGVTALDAAYDLLLGALETGDVLTVLRHCHSEGQQREIFTHPRCMPGSDAMDLAPDGPLAGVSFHGAYTWAAWFLRYMVRETRLLSLTEAIHKLTGLPARTLGIRDRGLLRPGAHADVVAFDPATIAERGTTFEPNVTAVGMRHVVVNGVVTLVDGRRTGRHGGAVLRRGAA